MVLIPCQVALNEQADIISDDAPRFQGARAVQLAESGAGAFVDLSGFSQYSELINGMGSGSGFASPIYLGKRAASRAH